MPTLRWISQERFIARLADASFAVAYAEGRKTIGYKDMARAVERAEEFFFLSGTLSFALVQFQS